MPFDRSVAQRFVALARVAAGALLLSMSFAATPASGSDRPEPVRDPVIAEVVRLLEAGLGEPLILRWLGEEAARPARPSADELIALKKAGATDALLSALLDRVEGVEAPPAAPPAPAPALETPPRPAAPETTAATRTAPAASGPVSLALSTLYVHWPEEGEPWDLVVYLDGEPFAPVPAARSARSAQPRQALREVPPGLHLLRWSQERHGERPGERGLHAARFDPEPLVFTLAPGAPATVDFEFRDPSGIPFASAKGPVTVRVRQSDREIATRLEGGDDPYRWPSLCEELEVNLAGRKPSLQERLLLKSCLRWDDLWTDLPGGVPGRDEVRPGPATAP